MADEWAQFETKPKDEWAQFETKPSGGPPAVSKSPGAKMSPVNLYSGKPATPPSGATDVPRSFNPITGNPHFEYKVDQSPRQPSTFEQKHPRLYGAIKDVWEGGGLAPTPLGIPGAVGEEIGQTITRKVLDAFRKKFGPALEKAPKETQSDLAFALFKETHGAEPASASQKVQAIKEMRDALKTAKPPAPPTPPRSGAQSTKSFVETQPATPKPPEPPRASGAQRTESFTKPQPAPPPEPARPSAAQRTQSFTQAQQAKPEAPRPSGAQRTQSFTSSTRPETAKQGGINKLSGPETPAPNEPTTITGQTTDAFAQTKRNNVAKGVIQNEKMTGAQFLDLSLDQQNEIISKYHPQHARRPYKQDTPQLRAKLKEYADRIDKLRGQL